MNEPEWPAKIRQLETTKEEGRTPWKSVGRLWLVWLSLWLAGLGLWFWLSRPAPPWQAGWVGWWTANRMEARPLWNLRALPREMVEINPAGGGPAYRSANRLAELGIWLEKSKAWSWSDWLLVEQIPEESPEVLLAEVRAGTDFLWQLKLRQNQLLVTTEALTRAGDEGSRRREDLFAPSRLSHGQWVHVAFTFNNEQERLFIDGRPVGTVPIRYTPISLYLATLKLGAALVHPPQEPSSQPVVWHDDVLAWDRVLEPEEMAALAAAGRGVWGALRHRQAWAHRWLVYGQIGALVTLALLVVLTGAGWMSARMRAFADELPRPSFRPVLMVLLCGLAVTITAALVVRTNGRKADQAKFDELLNRIHTETDWYWEKLAGLAMRARDWLATQPEPSPAAWSAWLHSNHFPHDYGGLIGIGYAEQVLPANLAAHQAKWSARYGFPYAVHPASGAQDARPITELSGTPQLPVVLYAPADLPPERWLTNGSILGRDLLFVSRTDRRTWSESVRVETAVARNEVSSSSLEEIAPEHWYGTSIAGLRLYVPWTLRTKHDDTQPLEPAAWRGLWFLSVDFKSVIAEELVSSQPLVGLRLYTGSMSADRYDLVADTGQINPLAADRPGAYLRGKLEIPFYHHRLFLDAWSTPLFEAQSTRWWPWWIAAGGLGITVLVAALLYVQIRAREAQQSVLDTLREANARLLAAYRDRERLSRDLHDGSIQNLYALGLHLQRVEQLLATTPGRARSELRESLGFLDHSIAELRKFIVSAGVENLEHQTPLTALQGLVERLQQTTDMKLHLQVDPAADRLAPRVGIQVLHVAREAVSNALRHSSGQVVDIRLRPLPAPAQPGESNGWWGLTITDDGKGYDPKLHPPARNHGLDNIAARAKELAGRSRVETTPGKGTSVVLEFPEHPADHEASGK